MSRMTTALSLIAAVGLLTGCESGSQTVASTPQIQSMRLNQLSAGGGIAGYDFYMLIEGVSTRVGTLLVTNGAFEEGPDPEYVDEMEFWRWEPGALADIESGGVDEISVDVFDTSETFDPAIVANFEDNTGWTAWTVNREFTLDKRAEVVWNNPGAGRVLYELEAAAWGGESGTITYYHMMDFSGGFGFPEMTWYIASDDYNRWVHSEIGDEDDGSIWEVRLTSSTVFEQTSVGAGYELATVK